MRRFILESFSKKELKNTLTLKEIFIMEEDKPQLTIRTLNDMSLESMVDTMVGNHGEDPSSYVLRDTNGNIVTDPKAIKIARDAMEKFSDSRFEYGGNFKTIMENKNKEIKKNGEKYTVGMMKKPKNIEYCPCCGEPLLEDN